MADFIHMATARDARLLFMAMFVLTALVKLFVLRRRYGRWSFSRCVVSVAVFSSVVWLMNWMLMNWGSDTPEMEPSDAFEWVSVGIMVLIYLLTFMAIALIPARVTAFIYRKLRLESSS
jgi:hypothetical protein